MSNKELNDLKKKIIPILKKNGIKRAGIFGSYARGEQKRNSDVDILINHSGKMSLVKISGLKITLEESLGKKVDLITYKYIHPELRRSILSDEVKII